MLAAKRAPAQGAFSLVRFLGDATPLMAASPLRHGPFGRHSLPRGFNHCWAKPCPAGKPPACCRASSTAGCRTRSWETTPSSPAAGRAGTEKGAGSLSAN